MQQGQLIISSCDIMCMFPEIVPLWHFVKKAWLWRDAVESEPLPEIRRAFVSKKKSLAAAADSETYLRFVCISPPQNTGTCWPCFAAGFYRPSFCAGTCDNDTGDESKKANWKIPWNVYAHNDITVPLSSLWGQLQHAWFSQAWEFNFCLYFYN